MALTLRDASSRPDSMVILESRLPTSCFLVKVRLGPSSSLLLLRTRRGTSTSGSASSSTETEPAKKIQLVPRRESFCLGLTVRSPGIMAKPVTVVVNPDAALVEVRASEDSSDEEALSGRVGRGARQTRRTVLDSLVELSLHSVAPSDAASNSVGQDMAD
ncbi:hypothetical protein Bca4012_065653 [Brassica carinata]